MKLYEYQVKSLFKAYGVPTENYYLATLPDSVVDILTSNNLERAVFKAQVLTGGRGKAGGVKLIHREDDVVNIAKQILGMEIKGYPVNQLMVSEAVDIDKEFYMSFTIERSSKSVLLILSPSGGVDIEEIAKKTPESIFKFRIDPFIGILNFKAREYAYHLSTDEKIVSQIVSIIKNAYQLFIAKDASLLEINPLVVTKNMEVLAIDGKMSIDSNAKYRQPDIVSKYQYSKEEILEVSAKEKGFSYVQLDGNIGCMVNGAGLAMATMDMIGLYGGKAANFLDIGGSSNPEKVIHAMTLLLSDSNVKVVLINIFGGITRCDDVAEGLLKALESIVVKVPIVVRLTGTNEKEGREMLKDSNLIVAKTMDEATSLAVKFSN